MSIVGGEPTPMLERELLPVRVNEVLDSQGPQVGGRRVRCRAVHRRRDVKALAALDQTGQDSNRDQLVALTEDHTQNESEPLAIDADAVGSTRSASCLVFTDFDYRSAT